MPLLPCPHCNHRIPVSISQAGSELACPQCQQVVTVPKLGELRQLESQSSPDPASPTAPLSAQTGTATSANEGARILFGGLLAIAGVAALAGAFCLIRYLTIEVPATTESHIQEVKQVFKQVSPAQLVREWQQMEKYGLDMAAPYNYKKKAIEKANWGRNGLICLAIFTVAVGTATVLGLKESRAARTPPSAA